jgi:hypothetical protein
VKKSHERFGEIIHEHFEDVGSAEFKARLHDASHGAFGEAADVSPETRPGMSKLKRALSRVASILHIH